MTYNLLKGKRGLIFGALNNKSIAWKVAEKAYQEGAHFVLTNTPVSMRLGNVDELAKACNGNGSMCLLIVSFLLVLNV
jgi:enoyl-[acyl-carrier protein] reductase I